MVARKGGEAVVIEMARQIALYLQTVGEGTLGSDLFVDEKPDLPDELIVLTDLGGNAGLTLASLVDSSGNAEYSLDAPEMWRHIRLAVRALTPSAAHQRIGEIVQKLLEPTEGIVAVEGISYTVHMKSLPSIQASDSNNRFQISCELEVRNAAPVLHPWLEALSLHCESLLNGEWIVYRGIPGTRRPCLAWQISGLQVLPSAGPICKVAMKCAGQLRAKDANEYVQAAVDLIEGMAARLKLPLNGELNKFVTLASPSMEIRPNDQASGQIDVTLIGSFNQSTESSPLMAELHTQFNLNL